jgi:hypothetical protein
VDVEKYITIHAKFWANHYIRSVSWVSVGFPEPTGRFNHDVGYSLREIAETGTCLGLSLSVYLEMKANYTNI